MKQLTSLIVALLCSVLSASAMSYEQAREQALFLTDKMAYELNLTDDQYEAAYEINLDYLMGVVDQTDLYGPYWQQRNLDLSYILFDWQYQAYLNATYFYRPLYWNAGYWHFGIYARYPRRDYFFYGRPHFYGVYRGGHSWRMNGGRSWYHGRSWGGPRPGGGHRVGMRDGWDRGDFGRGHHLDRGGRQNDRGRAPQQGMGNRNNNGNRTFGNMRGGSQPQQRNGSFGSQQPSNRQQPQAQPQQRGQQRNGSFSGSRPSSTRTTVGSQAPVNTGTSMRIGSGKPSSTFTPRRATPSGMGSGSSSQGAPRSFSGSGSHSGGNASHSGSQGGSRSFGGHR